MLGFITPRSNINCWIAPGVTFAAAPSTHLREEEGGKIPVPQVPTHYPHHDLPWFSHSCGTLLELLLVTDSAAAVPTVHVILVADPRLRAGQSVLVAGAVPVAAADRDVALSGPPRFATLHTLHAPPTLHAHAPRVVLFALPHLPSSCALYTHVGGARDNTRYTRGRLRRAHV